MIEDPDTDKISTTQAENAQKKLNQKREAVESTEYFTVTTKI